MPAVPIRRLQVEGGHVRIATAAANCVLEDQGTDEGAAGAFVVYAPERCARELFARMMAFVYPPPM